MLDTKMEVSNVNGLGPRLCCDSKNVRITIFSQWMHVLWDQKYTVDDSIDIKTMRL